MVGFPVNLNVIIEKLWPKQLNISMAFVVCYRNEQCHWKKRFSEHLRTVMIHIIKRRHTN